MKLAKDNRIKPARGVSAQALTTRAKSKKEKVKK